MYRKRQERRRKFLQHLIIFHPLILLVFMFVLGACARGAAGGAGALPAAQSAAEIPESVAASLSQGLDTGITAAFETVTSDPSAIAIAMAEAEQSSEIYEQGSGESGGGSEGRTVHVESEIGGQGGTGGTAKSEAQLPEESSVQLSGDAAEGAGNGRDSQKETTVSVAETTAAGVQVKENGNYTSKDEVALYLHLYGHLPSNYITKRKAEERGWDSRRGNLGDVLPGMSIGGSGFGNNEGLLPNKKGRKYYECDIDYDGGYRNAKRIVYSNDGLVFYTEDHYRSFEQLY